MGRRWNKHTNDAFVQRLSEVLDDSTILNIGERLAAVKGYRFRRRDDRLFLLKDIADTAAEGWDTLMKSYGSSAGPGEVTDVFLHYVSQNLYEQLGLPEPDTMEDILEARTITAKIVVSAKAAEDPTFLSGLDVQQVVHKLITEHFARSVTSAAEAAAEEAGIEIDSLTDEIDDSP